MVFPANVLVRTLEPFNPLEKAPTNTFPKGCITSKIVALVIVNVYPAAPIKLLPTGSVALTTLSKAPLSVLKTIVYVFKTPAALTPLEPLEAEVPAVPVNPLVADEPLVPLEPLEPEVPAVAF